MVARLLKDMGSGVQSVGRRKRLTKPKAMDDTDADEVSTKDGDVLIPNRPVEQLTRHRLKLVAQVRQYGLLSKLDTLPSLTKRCSA